MSTKVLVYFSVACYSFCGLALLFMPQEVLARIDTSVSTAVVLLAQLFGAAMLGIAMMNWTARGALLGGIYGRAVVAGNFTFAFISAMLLLRAQFNAAASPWLWCCTIVSVALAVAFGYLMFGASGLPKERS